MISKNFVRFFKASLNLSLSLVLLNIVLISPADAMIKTTIKTKTEIKSEIKTEIKKTENLFSVYQAALLNDPILKQAQATAAANKEALPQSRASLLPSLAGSASTNAVRFRQGVDSNNNENTSYRENNSLNAHSYTLSITQPIFNFQSWMQVSAAQDTAKQADAVYNGALQALIIRVTQAYFGVLQAQDTLEFVQAQKKSVHDQLKQIRSRYEVGAATMTDVYQAQSNDDALNAQVINAENTVNNSLENLKSLSNKNYDLSALATLKNNLSFIRPHPENVSDWIKIAEKNNWTLLAARYAEQASKKAIRLNNAGHLPTVNAVGAYQNGNGNALGFGQNTGNGWRSSIGLELNMPLYQGGYVMSKTRQAQDQYLAANSQTEFSRRQVILAVQQSFNNVMAGISKINADRAAVMSSQSSLDSALAAYHAGAKTILDVLTAQQNLYQAKTSLSADQYGYILNSLLLKQAAGSLSAEDILSINHWLLI